MSAFYDSDEFSVTLEERAEHEDLNPDESDSDGMGEGDELEVFEDRNETVGMELENRNDAQEEMDPVLEVENNNGEENDGLEMPMRKIKNPSAVWKLAEKVEGGAKCKLCEKTLQCSRSNTTNIIGHLTIKHWDRAEVKQLIKEQDDKREKLKIKRLQKEKKKSNLGNQPLIKNFSVKRRMMDPLKKKKLDTALVKMTICMNRPFDDVENHFFRNVLFIAEPNYIVPSRRRHTALFDMEANAVER